MSLKRSGEQVIALEDVDLTFETADGPIHALSGINLQINKGEERMAIFNLLKQEKEAIEAEVGSALDWEELPDRHTSYISLRKHNSDPTIKTNWPEQQKWMLEQLEKFRSVFGTRIKTMDTGDWQPEDLEDGE